MPSPVAFAGGRWLKLPLPTLQPSRTIITAGTENRVLVGSKEVAAQIIATCSCQGPS